MAPYCSCCHPCQLAMVLFIFMSSSLLPSSLSLRSASKLASWNCVIKENKNIVRQKHYDYYFNLDLPDMGSLNISQLTFRMETCDAQLKNLFCTDWKTKDIYNTCKRVNMSKGVLCEISEIDATELKMNRRHYAFFAQYNSTDIVFQNFLFIKSLPCECKDFSFDPNLSISTIPMLGEAEINMKPFSEPKSDILDFDLTITPNKSVIIKKDGNKFQYQLSKLYPCQKYSVDIALQLKGTTFKQNCKNDWKMKPGIIELPIHELEMDEVSCSRNLTHINLNPTSTLNSPFYYTFSIEEESFMKNFTDKVSVALRTSGNITSRNLSGFVSLCAPNCDKCGIKQPIKCYSNIQIVDITSEDLHKTTSSLYMGLIISLASIVIVIAVISTLYIIYHKRKTKRADSCTETLAPRHSDPSSNHQLSNSHESDFVEPARPDPEYEKISDYHVYDKPDLKGLASGLSNRKEQSEELLEGEETHSEEKMFLFFPENELKIVA